MEIFADSVLVKNYEYNYLNCKYNTEVRIDISFRFISGYDGIGVNRSPVNEESDD